MAGKSVTWASTVMGVPSAPKATGAVLNMRVKVRASSAGMPIMMSNALVMATGVPKPAMPSSRHPKQKPMTTSTTRRSFGRLGEQPLAKCIEASGDRPLCYREAAR